MGSETAIEHRPNPQKSLITAIFFWFSLDTFSKFSRVLQNFLPLIVAVGVSLVIYTCNLLKKPSASSISSVTLIAILITQTSDNYLIYALHRTIETAFGVIVAILINKYIHPPKDKNTNNNSI